MMASEDSMARGGAAPHQAESGDTRRYDAAAWVEGLYLAARHFGLSASIESALLTARSDSSGDRRARLTDIGRNLGLRIKFADPGDFTMSNWHLPVLLELNGGEVLIVHTLSSDGQASYTLAGEQGLQSTGDLSKLMADAALVVIARPSRGVPDARVDDYIRPFQENWLKRILFRDLKSYRHVLIASVIANTLGLAGVLFTMQVYDRVIPAESFNTLFVLFGGVLLAFVFDFMIRRARMGIIDIIGKRSDLEMSDTVYGRALRIRNRARPASTGSFIAQLRDLEQFRELLTSTTVSAVADMPFFFIFCFVFWYIGGILVLVPLAALVLMVLPGLLLQKRLRAGANEAMREASLRNALLVESVQGLEDIKLLQSEERFQRQWRHYNEVSGEAQMKLRDLTNSLSVWSQQVIAGVYAVTVLAGVPLVIAGDITTGTLIGASILGSRMMAPMAQLGQIIGRFQHARIAKEGLDNLMALPVDNPEQEQRIHCSRIVGNYAVKDAAFRYGNDDTPVVLSVPSLHIEAGERIAVLGRNGAGKSSLLLALSGLMEASAGEISLDGYALAHIDPADVRRDVGLVGQNARLFHGTLRENLTMGALHASDDELWRVLVMVAADRFIRKLPSGLDYLIQEGGGGLSGGQKQSILLARALLRDPAVILLDEPTASMDEATERHFIEQFATWSAGKTVVIATHRRRVLDLAERILFIENGTVRLDDEKNSALKKLSAGGESRS
ncbi:type I secretion system permease/ATPase [Alcanivoracaceae bacterium MT1]